MEIIGEGDSNKAVKGMMNLKTQVLTTFNRFVLLATDDTLNFITSSVNVEQFIQMWLLNMGFFSSKKGTRINAFAL